MRRAVGAIILVTLLVAVAACGGGGGGDPSPAPLTPSTTSTPPSTSAPPSTSTPPTVSPTPTPPPAPVNRAPWVPNPIGTVLGITSHRLSFDASRGGTTFVDPDGDVLTYTVTVHSNLFTVSGTQISGTLPDAPIGVSAVIVAKDGRGGEHAHWFNIMSRPNALPIVANPNSVVFTTAGTLVIRDLTQGNTTFTDPDGDSLTYTVEMTSPPGRGIAITGLSVAGALSNANLASFKITASDGYGGSASDPFVIAVPAPLPGEPRLPATSFVYADEELPLPYAFRLSRIGLMPFWDTASTSGSPPTNAGATLGRVLFYDKRLSVVNTHSCASCHEQERGFTTGDRLPRGVLNVPLTRNAMALANSRYNFRERYFFDMRTLQLEGVALQPIEDPRELGNTLPLLISKLEATSFYPPLFERAFGTPEITRERIASALAQFLRAMITYRSRFDQAFLPLEDPSLTPPPPPAQFLTPLELQGEDLFFESLCHQCHTSEIQVMDDPFNNGLDLTLTDPGIEGDFRAPSLRNIAVTGPYMHDGRFDTLRAVIDHYDHGVVDSVELSPTLRVNGGGLPRRLNLTEQQKNALEAFLRTMTDDAFLNDPKFADPF